MVLQRPSLTDWNIFRILQLTWCREHRVGIT